MKTKVGDNGLLFSLMNTSLFEVMIIERRFWPLYKKNDKIMVVFLKMSVLCQFIY